MFMKKEQKCGLLASELIIEDHAAISSFHTQNAAVIISLPDVTHFVVFFFFLNFGGFLSALNPCKSCELIFIFHMQCIFIFLFSNFISLANSYQSVWSRFVRWKMVPPPVFYNYFLICQICVLGKRDLFTLSQGWSIYLTCCNNFFLSPFSELI